MPADESAALVRRGVRAAAFGELERVAGRPRRRASRLLAGRSRCATTPERLRDRVEGEISERQLDALYRHLDRCHECAAIAGRCELAEWYLGLDLAAPGQAPRNGAGRPDPPQRLPNEGIGPAPSVPAARPAPAGGALALWREAPAGAAPVRRSRLGPRRIAVGGLVVAAGIVAGVSQGSRGHARPAVKPVAAIHALRAPFVVGGARYAVFRDPAQGWTGFLATDPGSAMKWLAVTVRVRNLALSGFDPRVLDFRVIDRSGAAHAPDPALGTEPARARPPVPLAAGQLVETRLGFRLPAAATGLLLSFVPAAGVQPIVTSLGP